MIDLVLAIGHHLLVFALVGILAYELGLVRSGVGGTQIARLARVDLCYGVLAAAIIVVGFTRAVFAAKGWAYYEANLFFWAKIVTFLAVGLVSVGPTVMFIRWRRALRVAPEFIPPQRDIRIVRNLLWTEAALFALIPIFAAAMARGYGALG